MIGRLLPPFGHVLVVVRLGRATGGWHATVVTIVESSSVSSTPSRRHRAVFWDFGGVITSSPFEAFNRYEEANGLPHDFIRSVNSVDPDTNAWARIERREGKLLRPAAPAPGTGVSTSQVVTDLPTTIRRIRVHVRYGCTVYKRIDFYTECTDLGPPALIVHSSTGGASVESGYAAAGRR